MEYRYYKQCDKIMRFHLECDEEPSNPRYDFDGNIGKMICWHRRYNLGDYKENEYIDNEHFLNDMVRTHISEEIIINSVKTKKTSNGLELRYNKKEQLWELWSYYFSLPEIIETSSSAQNLVDDIVETMSQWDKWKLLEKHAHIVYLPLYLYDHGGITMSTSDFSCGWDSGRVGYIYTDKDTILKNVGAFVDERGNLVKANEKNWKKAAYKSMTDEVHMYDMYLQGEVYGIIIEEFVNGEWNEIDSCWGFFSDSCGNKLYEEIARDFGISEKLFDNFEAVQNC